MPEYKNIAYKGEIRNCVVIDCANIIHVDRSKFSFERLKNTIQKVSDFGWNRICIMKEGTYNAATNQNKKIDSNLSEKEISELKGLVESGQISLATKKGAKEFDDEVIIRTAREKNGWILSKDKYRGQIEYFENEGQPEIAEDIEVRRVDITWLGITEPSFNLPKNKNLKTMEEITSSTGDDYGNQHLDCFVITDYSTHLISIPLGVAIGRRFFKGCDFYQHIQENIGYVSSSHFRIDRKENNQIFVTDLKSTNGTHLGQVQLPENSPNLWERNNILRIAKIKLARVNLT